MKKILLILLAVSSFAACKKSKMRPVPPLVSDGTLIGKWELHSRTGGNITPPDTTYPPGNGNMLQFNADSTYKRYINWTLSKSGIFHTRNHFTASASMIRFDELYFDNDTTSKLLIETAALLNGTLNMRSTMPDVGGTIYNKIAN